MASKLIDRWEMTVGKVTLTVIYPNTYSVCVFDNKLKIFDRFHFKDVETAYDFFKSEIIKIRERNFVFGL